MMNINRKEIKVKIGEKDYSMVLDFESAILYQETVGDSIFSGMTKIGSNTDLKAFAYLVASTLRDENGVIVGIDFVKQLDLVLHMELLMSKLGELMNNSLPTEDTDKVKKKK